jgi:hypothetical protein
LQYNYFERAFIRILVFIEESGTYFFNTTSIQFSADVDRIWNINGFQRFSQRRRLTPLPNTLFVTSSMLALSVRA